MIRFFIPPILPPRGSPVAAQPETRRYSGGAARGRDGSGVGNGDGLEQGLLGTGQVIAELLDTVVQVALLQQPDQLAV
jgi:hypothetical protein